MLHWLRAIYVQPAFVIHRCLRGTVPQKISNFLNQKSPISWDLTHSFFPLFIQSLWGGLPPNALILDDKKNALFSYHTAQSLSEPGLQISRGLTLDFLSSSFSFLSHPAGKSRAGGEGSFHRICRGRCQGPPPPSPSQEPITAINLPLAIFR